MSEAKGPESAIDRLIVQIGAAVSMRALYAAAHPNVVKATERLVEAVEAACAERGRDDITFLVVGDDLVVERKPLRKASLYHEQFARALRRRRVERLTLARGIDAEECRQLVEPLAVGGTPVSTPHVVVGSLELRGEGGEAGAEGIPDPLSGDSLSAAREAFTELRSDKKAGLRRLEEVVWGLMDVLSHTTREILPLAPLKNHDEYTFVHSVNVSLLTLCQARGFGIQGDLLHAIGLGALLHDIGKLKIPLAVLNKPGKLEDEEWRVMQSHAELGARHLCEIPTSQPVASRPGAAFSIPRSWPGSATSSCSPARWWKGS
ncbi:MAG TPA: HD domain-containing phosphohydrolase [Vicinamibacteria bacterium]|nr:HD domain-containing phosphohydrolase [Vicinamibacteria bacterium]